MVLTIFFKIGDFWVVSSSVRIGFIPATIASMSRSSNVSELLKFSSNWLSNHGGSTPGPFWKTTKETISVNTSRHYLQRSTRLSRFPAIALSVLRYIVWSFSRPSLDRLIKSHLSFFSGGFVAAYLHGGRATKWNPNPGGSSQTAFLIDWQSTQGTSSIDRYSTNEPCTDYRPRSAFHRGTRRSSYFAGHHLPPTSTPFVAAVGHVALHGNSRPHDELLSSYEHGRWHHQSRQHMVPRCRNDCFSHAGRSHPSCPASSENRYQCGKSTCFVFVFV